LTDTANGGDTDDDTSAWRAMRAEASRFVEQQLSEGSASPRRRPPPGVMRVTFDYGVEMPLWDESGPLDHDIFEVLGWGVSKRTLADLLALAAWWEERNFVPGDPAQSVLAEVMARLADELPDTDLSLWP
jgi:hypothetical protein